MGDSANVLALSKPTRPRKRAGHSEHYLEFYQLHAAYLQAVADHGAASVQADDDELQRSDERIAHAVWQMIQFKASVDFMIETKLELLVTMMDGGGDWRDGREGMLAASILRDLRCKPA